MNHELLEYLSQAYTPEYIDTVDIVSQALVDMGVETHIDAITLQLPSASNYEPTDFSNEVVALIRRTAIDTVTELGILVDEEIPNTLLAHIVKWAGTFDSSDDDESLLAILDNETDDKEVLMQFLSIGTGVPVDEWVEHTVGFTPEQITNLHAMITGWLVATTNDATVPLEASTEAHIARYGDIDPMGMITRMYHDGVPQGVSIESLLNVYSNHVAGLESFDDQVRTLLAMHIYSNEPRDTIHVETMESVRGFVVDDGPDVEMRVRRIVDETLTGMTW